MKYMLVLVLLLFGIPAAAQQSVMLPVHQNIHAAFPPGGQVTLSALQTQLRAIVSAGVTAGTITSAQQTTLNAQIGTGGTAGSVLTSPATAASLRTVLLNINTDGSSVDDQSVIAAMINGALAGGNAIGISADVTRRVLKELAFSVMKYNIGMNLGWVLYYEGSAYFSDAALSFNNLSSVWATTTSTSTPAPMDPSGAPTSCSPSCGTNLTAYYPSGTYTASWQTTPSGGSLSCSVLSAGAGYSPSCSVGTATCQPNTPVAGTQTCTAPVTIVGVTPTSTDYADSSAFKFAATPPISEIHIMAPASLQENGNSMWTKQFIDSIKPFSTLRFMDVVETNTDVITVNWKDRLWPTTALAKNCIGGNTTNSCISGSRGNYNTSPNISSVNPVGRWAYEDMIALANTYGKDLWINIPQFVNDNFMCRFIRLIAYGESGVSDNGSNCSLTAVSGSTGFAQDETPLSPNRHVYLEQCNEPWNFSFQCVNTQACFGNNGPGNSGFSCPTIGMTSTVPPSAFIQAIMATTAWQSIHNSSGSNGCQTSASVPSPLCIGGQGGTIGIVFGSLGNLRDWNFTQKIYGQSITTTINGVPQTYTTNPSQIRVMLSTQIGGNDSVLEMAFLNGNHAAWAVTCNCNAGASISFPDPGQVTNWIYAEIQAPYFNLNNPATNGASVSQIFTALNTYVSQSGTIGQALTRWQGDITEQGGNIHPLSYEHGQQLADGNPTCNSTCVANELAAQSNTSMYSLYLTYYSLMSSNMVYGRHNLQNHFNNVLDWSTNGGSGFGGYFGAVYPMFRHGSQKYDAMVNLVSRPGDVNLDGVVDAQDCAILSATIASGLPAGSDGPWWRDGDLNHDGVVNATDKAILNSVIEGAQCP